MPTLKRNKKTCGSSSHTSETHKFLAQVQQQQQQQQQPQKDHNLKRKAAEPEDVAEEDSENEVVESPEVKKARMKYLKRLYSGNKQQSEVVETEEKKEEGHSEDKAESQKKKSEGIWSNAKQSEVVEKEESHSNEDDAEIQKKKYGDIWRQANMLKYVVPIPKR